VAIIDPDKRTVKTKIGFSIPGMRREAIQPVGIGITKDGQDGLRRARAGQPDRCGRCQHPSGQQILLVGQRVWHMAFTPDEKYLLVTNGVSNDVQRHRSVAAQKVTKTIQVGELPWGITIAPQ